MFQLDLLKKHNLSSYTPYCVTQYLLTVAMLLYMLMYVTASDSCIQMWS